MAACLINITGTSGSVFIRYIDSGSVERSVVAGLGVIYLDDTGSDYTYTTISGNAVAASGCITITNLPYTYYFIDWELLRNTQCSCINDYVINALLLDNTVYTIADSFYLGDKKLKVITNINSLNLEIVKASAYKITSPSIPTVLPIVYSIVVRVIGTEIPSLRVRNADNTRFLYIKGVVTPSIPIDYTLVDTCPIIPL